MPSRPKAKYFKKCKKAFDLNVKCISAKTGWLNWEEWIKFAVRKNLPSKSKKTPSSHSSIDSIQDWLLLPCLKPSIKYPRPTSESSLIDIFICAFVISNLTAMNHESLSSDSFDEENIISRASPKSYEQANQPARSRFSILADINEAGIFSKKNEEQSLLSKYMKDLHQ